MQKTISKWKYNNGKAIEAGICDFLDSDLMFLKIKENKESYTHYLRPDEAVLIIQLLSTLILKRVVGYEVNLGKKEDKDY